MPDPTNPMLAAWRPGEPRPGTVCSIVLSGPAGRVAYQFRSRADARAAYAALNAAQRPYGVSMACYGPHAPIGAGGPVWML